MDKLASVALTPAEAWQPLPSKAWDSAAAAHLLRRLTFAATPASIEQAVAEGLEATLTRYLREPELQPESALLQAFRQTHVALHERLQDQQNTKEERRRLQVEVRDNIQSAMAGMRMEWLQFARQPERQANEKWVLFLMDILVIGTSKVRNPLELFAYHQLVRTHSLGLYGKLCQEIALSPAMIRYLDLAANTRRAPNENFARELFELFILGEGNYTEQDIKEAARAFTGYRLKPNGEVVFTPSLHDSGRKTVFGVTGNFTGDDIVELALAQPAGSTYVPSQMVAYYLTTDAPLPSAYLESLGEIWRQSGFSLHTLARRFFGSRLFFQPQYRGNYIKSPIQFYLGMLTELDLEVVPVPQALVQGLRSMGQLIYAPPNVRGWVYGPAWISSSTLAARRQVVQAAFTPLDREKMNADDLRRVEDAEAVRPRRWHFEPTELASLSDHSPEEVAEIFIQRFFPAGMPEALHTTAVRFLRDGPGTPDERVRQLAQTLLEAPPYHLC